MDDPEPGDEGRALRLAVQVGEGLRRGGWWAAGSAAGALTARLGADLTSLAARGSWEPSFASHAVGLAGAATVGLAVGSPPLRDPQDVSPVALTLCGIAAPWFAVVVATVVDRALAGASSLRGLEAAIALFRDPNETLVHQFFLLAVYAWALGLARWAHAGGDLTGVWLRRLPVRAGAIGPAVVAGAVLPWVIAVAIGGGLVQARDAMYLPATVLLASGAVSVPAGALLAEQRLRPWLRARLLGGAGDGSPPVSSGP